MKKIKAITKADYSFSLVSEDISEVYNAFMELLAEPEILIEKKTKKGIKTVNIMPDLEIVSYELKENSIDMIIRLSAGTQTNYNPTLFIEALKSFREMPFEVQKIRRTKILCENNEKFF